MVFVGQVGNLRWIVNPPGRCGSEPVILAVCRAEYSRLIANPPQVDNLPHKP